MSTLAIRCRVVQSRDVGLHNFDGLAMSGLAFSVAPFSHIFTAHVQTGYSGASDQKSDPAIRSGDLDFLKERRVTFTGYI